VFNIQEELQRLYFDNDITKLGQPQIKLMQVDE